MAGSRVLIYLLASLSFVSVGANALLAWRWQDDSNALQRQVVAKHQSLSSAQVENRTLTKKNAGFQEEIAAKNQELDQKITELAKKAAELNRVTDELKTKKTELADAQKQIDNQKSQLQANADELAKLRNRPPLFSFQVKSSTLADIEAKKAAAKQVVTDAYEVIESLYGKPYLLHSVTISFVESFTNPKASGEIVITNSDKGLDLEIRLKDFDRNNFNDVNTIIHEVIHSFHGLAALEPAAFEEGITVAASEAVMVKMRAAGTIPNFSKLYLRITDAQYQEWQNTLSIPRNQSAFYGSDQVADFYQVLGKTWYDLYLNDNDFFKQFNEKIYAKKQAGQEITEQMVLNTVREVAPGANLSGAAWNLK